MVSLLFSNIVSKYSLAGRYWLVTEFLPSSDWLNEWMRTNERMNGRSTPKAQWVTEIGEWETWFVYWIIFSIYVYIIVYIGRKRVTEEADIISKI